MAEQSSIEFFSGNDITLRFSVIDTETSLPLNMSGSLELIWGLAKRQGVLPIITKTLNEGVNLTDAANGIVEVDLHHDETEPLKGEYYHEMRLTTSGDKQITLAYGEVNVINNSIRD